MKSLLGRDGPRLVDVAVDVCRPLVSVHVSWTDVVVRAGRGGTRCGTGFGGIVGACGGRGGGGDGDGRECRQHDQRYRPPAGPHAAREQGQGGRGRAVTRGGTSQGGTASCPLDSKRLHAASATTKTRRTISTCNTVNEKHHE